MDIVQQRMSYSSALTNRKVDMSDIRYERHFVAFLDLLGFKDMIDESRDPAKAIDNIQTLDEALTWVENRYKEKWSWEENQFELRMFSDCICVWLPAVPSNIDAFFQVTSYVQSILTLNEIPIRGAMSIGEHYVSERMIFSEGLVSAYLLESKPKGQPPRIVISQELIDYVETEGTLVDRAHLWNAYTLHDPLDNRRFADYLNFMPAPADGGEALKLHRNWIIKQLAKYQDNPAVQPKYEWLRWYHNHWCNIFEKTRHDLADLLIETD